MRVLAALGVIFGLAAWGLATPAIAPPFLAHGPIFLVKVDPFPLPTDAATTTTTTLPTTTTTPAPPATVAPSVTAAPRSTSVPVPPATPTVLGAAVSAGGTISTDARPGGGFGDCVRAREDGSGDPLVMNASGHFGWYQFSYGTWVEYGGAPADFGSASTAEQDAVFANAMAAGGESNWSPYDGC